MRNVGIFIVFLYFFTSTVEAWDNEELEIFDLVEEINQNFYELMGIKQDATLFDLKRAFRNLSIVLHPDKNDAEDANIRFRNLVFVYEVLKDKSKREKYDKVLRDGLPNWKSALYYYRRARKMGLAEMTAILFVIITIGQYVVAWGVYFEKKYTAEQIFGSRLKKMQKKSKVSMGIDDILNEIPTPSIKNTLPFQIPLLIWYLPSMIKSLFSTFNEITQQELEKKRRKAEEVQREKELEEELIKQKEVKKELKENMRRRKQEQKAPEKTEEELAGYSQIRIRQLTEEDAVRPATTTKVTLSGGFWSDDDLLELIRLVKKYPSGTANRWDIIGDHMTRSVPEVTFMAAKLKENGYRVPGHTDSVAENLIHETADTVKKIKTKKAAAIPTAAVSETNWSQEQQQALETAITKYPKANSGDRWTKIANNVPGKSREECLQRYKYLVELVKNKKSDVNETIAEADTITESRSQGVDESKAEDAIIGRASNDDEDDGESRPTLVEEVEEEETIVEAKNKGKRRNKRKERKKRMEFSSDEDDYDYSN